MNGAYRPLLLMMSFAWSFGTWSIAHAQPEPAMAASAELGSTATPESPKVPAPVLASPSAENVHAVATPAGKKMRLPIFGVGIDVGVPDGGNVSIVARPCPWARVHVAMGNNSMSYGWRLGAALLPLRQGPAFVVEYGHYRDGNANPLAGKLIGSSFEPSPLFERVGYDYVNLHLGLNFGYRRFVVFVQGGLSIVRGQIHNANEVVHDATAGLNNTDVSVHSDPTIKASGFAGKIGVIAYVW